VYLRVQLDDATAHAHALVTGFGGPEALHRQRHRLRARSGRDRRFADQLDLAEAQPEGVGVGEGAGAGVTRRLSEQPHSIPYLAVGKVRCGTEPKHLAAGIGPDPARTEAPHQRGRNRRAEREEPAHLLERAVAVPAHYLRVEIERVDDADEADALKALVQKHADATGSANAKRILAAWQTSRARFIKVIPKDYKRVLACLRKAHDQGLSGDDAIMAAFEENSHDLSRVGGN